jgi:hypothetical protein
MTNRAKAFIDLQKREALYTNLLESKKWTNY